MVDAKREISFLPPKNDLVVQTAAFEQMKKQLAPIGAGQSTHRGSQSKTSALLAMRSPEPGTQIARVKEAYEP